MFTKLSFRPVLLASSLFLLQGVRSQVSTGNNSPSLGDYVGCDGATLFPLQVRHNANQSIQWWTDSIQRMQLWNRTNPTINTFTLIPQKGFLGISDVPAFFNTAPPGPAVSVGPFSRIHLVDTLNSVATNPTTYLQQLGYRPWQRNGVTMTGNRDQCYMGAKYSGADSSDIVLQWSDNPDDQTFGTDRLRFLFTTRYAAASYGARSAEGMEAFRVLPANDTSALVGIGDFYRAGIINATPADPTERLHVNDGTVRIDSLIPDYKNDTLSRVVMTDGTGRLHWRKISTWPQNPSPGAGCDWEVDALTNRMITAWRGAGSNGTCPEIDWKVGIGVTNPGYKLDVLHNAANGGGSGGLRVSYISQQSGWAYGVKSELNPPSGTALDRAAGVHSTVSGGTAECWGVLGSASGTTTTSALIGGVSATANATSGTIGTAYGTRSLVITNAGSTLTTAHGVYGEVQGGGLATKAYGVYGWGQRGSTETYGGYFWGNGPSNTTTTYGVLGRATGAGTNWAGFFTGPISVAGTVYPSDEHLKTDIQDLEGPTELLMQLHPKSYTYRQEEFPQMDLPDGLRYGFIAQDVQEVFPQFTTPVHQPEQLDSAGNEVFASLDYLGLNTGDIIPLLVGAVQEQHGSVSSIAAVQGVQTLELQALQDRMRELEALLAACCARGDADGMRGVPATTNALSNDPATDSKLRIVPNPFSEPPTVFYTLDRSGRPADGGMRHMQLIANSADGKELHVLQDATLQAGDYQYAWDTNNLAPGMYYLTLLLDGQPVVKKAVKVTR